MEGAEEMENLLALLLILIPKADLALLMSLDELGATLDFALVVASLQLVCSAGYARPPLGVPADLQSAVKK